jgi:hypothetical protein
VGSLRAIVTQVDCPARTTASNFLFYFDPFKNIALTLFTDPI